MNLIPRRTQSVDCGVVTAHGLKEVTPVTCVIVSFTRHDDCNTRIIRDRLGKEVSLFERPFPTRGWRISDAEEQR